MGNFIFRRIETLFLWSSGANLEVLEQVPTEKSKYFGIGGTIVFTALMASFAGGYGFFTAFKSFELAIPFGIFWGCLIFNLDRYIVASFGVGDGKKTISKQELIEAAIKSGVDAIKFQYRNLENTYALKNFFYTHLFCFANFII